MRKRGSRASSGPWSRLKPSDQDPLESMGLPSKGDARLLDFKTQEKYYTKIVERYMSFCSDAGERGELLRRFSALDITESTQPPVPSAAPPVPPPPAPPSPEHANALHAVLSALRKLREGIVASHRTDDFATQAYMFCIRLAVLVKHPPTYHPAILHLLRSFRPTLTSVETTEVVAYLILDAACRRQNLAEAYALRGRWGVRDPKVDAALTALAHDNYVAFWKVRRSVDGHRARLMEFSEPDMRTIALKCFGRAYLSVDLDFLERCTAEVWEGLKAKEGVGWELEGSKVVIRRVRGR